MIRNVFVGDPPGEPWLSQGWLREYLAIRGFEGPHVDEVLARLDDLPQTICHYDFHPANVLGRDASVAIAGSASQRSASSSKRKLV